MQFGLECESIMNTLNPFNSVLLVLFLFFLIVFERFLNTMNLFHGLMTVKQCKWATQHSRTMAHTQF